MTYLLLVVPQIIHQEDKMNLYRKYILFFFVLFFLPALNDLTTLSEYLSEKALKESEANIELALSLSQQSLVANPKNAKAWVIGGKIYLLMDDISAAERFLEKAKILDSSLSETAELDALIEKKKEKEEE